MNFATPLVPGTLLGREKRFLVHVRLDDGRTVVAHTNNTGSMLGCNTPGSRVWLSPADAPHRRLKWTYELVEADGVLVGINTARANRLAEEAIRAGVVAPLAGYRHLRREVRAEAGSRVDLRLENADDGGPPCWVEVKNVTLVRDGAALFPDAPTARGRRHLAVLAARVAAGERAAMLYVVQRKDARRFAPAADIDPAYAAALREAAGAGVQVLAYRAAVSPTAIRLETPLAVELDDPPADGG